MLFAKPYHSWERSLMNGPLHLRRSHGPVRHLRRERIIRQHNALSGSVSGNLPPRSFTVLDARFDAPAAAATANSNALARGVRLSILFACLMNIPCLPTRTGGGAPFGAGHFTEVQ
jgi:hypothetical protein